jgi:hydroxymethylpyrimidine pyrophosphatase-like HAD family hydrolase
MKVKHLPVYLADVFFAIAPLWLTRLKLLRMGWLPVCICDILDMSPYQIARPLLIACDRYGMKTASEYGGRHYSNFVVSDMWENITYFDVVDFSAHELDAEKLYMVVEKPEDVLFIEKNISEGLYLKVSSDNLAMVMHKDATKAKAVAELARQWGIPQSRIVSFGDDSNDLDMLEYSGIGVAMGNALDEVKSVADFICTSNDEDGLAEWISSYVDLS